MCAICGRAILPCDLQPLGEGGLMVCRAARWCLVAWLQNATPAQIASMHASASESTLRSAQTVLVRRTGPESKQLERATRSNGLPDFVRLPIP